MPEITASGTEKTTGMGKVNARMVFPAGNRNRTAARVQAGVLRWLVRIAALLTAAVLLFLIGYILVMGIPNLKPSLFEWEYNSDNVSLMPALINTVLMTAFSLVIATPLGIFAAIWLVEYAKRGNKLVRVVRVTTETLQGIPSIVYGLVGLMVLVPFIRETFNTAAGESLLAAIVVLAVMILPSIISVSETALNAVPREYEEASLALGATDIETYFRISAPAAKSGIAAAVVLGVGRAIGEAMAIMMVAGNVANMPNLLSSVRFLTTGIAVELAYSSGLQRQALFSIGLVLFLFIMCINVILNVFLKRDKEG